MTPAINHIGRVMPNRRSSQIAHLYAYGECLTLCCHFCTAIYLHRVGRMTVCVFVTSHVAKSPAHSYYMNLLARSLLIRSTE